LGFTEPQAVVTYKLSIVGVVLLLVAIRALFTTRLKIKQGNSNANPQVHYQPAFTA